MTPGNDILEQLESLGVRVVAEGDMLRASPAASVTPAVRELIVAHRAALLASLQPVDLRDMPIGPDTVMCANCKHFVAKAGARPDGWCRNYQTEIWQYVPFQCAGFEAS